MMKFVVLNKSTVYTLIWVNLRGKMIAQKGKGPRRLIRHHLANCLAQTRVDVVLLNVGFCRGVMSRNVQ